MVAALLVSTVSTVWAFEFERPSQDIDIRRSFSSGSTDNTASVGLGIFVDDYDKSATEYGDSDSITFNVSMIGTTRKGIQYSYDTISGVPYWMEPYAGDILYQFPNVGDDWGTWVELPGLFRSLFYGGTYKNVYYDDTWCQAWICSNGFISFDVSNSTSPGTYSIPNSAAPNAIIAPLWADLMVDSASTIIVQRAWVITTNYFEVIWQNVLHKSTGKRLTFYVALEGYGGLDDGQPYTRNGAIWMAYKSVSSIYPYSYTFGVEDQEGLKGAGGCVSGSNLDSVNGKTLIFYDCTPSRYVKHMYLTMEDTTTSNARYYIEKNDPKSIRGYNCRTTNPTLDPDPTKMWVKPLTSAVNILATKAGAAMGIGWAGPVGTLISFGLIAWGLYDYYAYCQYSNIDKVSLRDSGTNPGTRTAHLKVPGKNDAVYDASLNITCHWVLDPPGDMSTRQLKVSAIVEYYEYPSGTMQNVTTIAYIKTGPDNNNSFDTAYTVGSGFYGDDPMLWLGGYDTYDYYKATMYSGYPISVTMNPPYQQDFNLYLYNPSRVLKASSTNGAGIPETIQYTPDSTGTWFILVKHVAGQGFYNMSISISQGGGGGGGCPYVFTWDGRGYAMDNNILPASEVNNGTDVEDFYMLTQPLKATAIDKGYAQYNLQIREFEDEIDYIDQMQLIAVDHAHDSKVAVTPRGEIITYKKPSQPLSCLDNHGHNRLNEIGKMDGDVSNPATFFQGYKDDWLILNFGHVTSPDAKLILRDDQKCADVCINVQVSDANGNWQTVAVLHPRNFWSIEAVNLASYVPQKGDLVVRLLWTAPHRLDFAGLDTSPALKASIRTASSIKAVHSTQGDVTESLLFNDNVYAELTYGQQITASFVLPNKAPETQRSFMLYTEGFYYLITP